MSGAQSRPCKRPHFPFAPPSRLQDVAGFGTLKKRCFQPPTNRRKLCFRLHHRRRSHEEKCNRLHPVKLAKSPVPYGVQAFSPPRPHHECNQKKQAVHFEKTPPPPYCHWVWSLETPSEMERCLRNLFAFLCKTLHKMKKAIAWEAPQPAWARALIALA